MKNDKKIMIDGRKWDLKVTRNMSFWHQWLSSYGHYHHMKDFGVNSPLIQSVITFNGTQTHIFSCEPNYSLYNAAFSRAVDGKNKVNALEKNIINTPKVYWTLLINATKNLMSKIGGDLQRNIPDTAPVYMLQFLSAG